MGTPDGRSPAAIDVRDLGYRWGSLGKSDRVNFHWATMQLAPRLVDYVIVHELAHIHEPNHTPEFWLRVERAMPNFQNAKDDLARVGSGLWLGEGNRRDRRVRGKPRRHRQAGRRRRPPRRRLRTVCELTSWKYGFNYKAQNFTPFLTGGTPYGPERHVRDRPCCAKVCLYFVD